MQPITRITLLFSLIASAAIASEPESTNTWKTGLTLGLGMNRGNTRKLQASARLYADRQAERTETHLSAQGQYGETGEQQDDGSTKDVTDVQNGSLNASHGWTLGEKGYAGLSAQLLNDHIANIDYRAILTPSIGGYLLRETGKLLRFEVGPAYVIEKVSEARDDYLSARLANRWEWAISETASLWQTAEYIVRADDMDQYLINVEAGVKAAATDRISLNIGFKDNYNNRPAQGKKPNDLSLTAGIDYTF